MVYAIIAGWDNQKRVTRYNYVETEVEATAIVDRLHGVGDDALPPAKQALDAYFVVMPPAPIGTGLFQHRARFWVADPANEKVSFDAVACHAWQSKVTGRAIDAEADTRIGKVSAPADIAALRAAAQTLKNTLANKTPEEILAVQPDDNVHWPL